MIALKSTLSTSNGRNEFLIKGLLLFLFLIFNENFYSQLPESYGLVLRKIFKNSTISIFAIALVVNWLFDRAVTEKIRKTVQNKFLWYCIIFIVIHIIALFYSANKKEASFIIEKKLSIIIFPLIFATIKLNTESKFRIYDWFVKITLLFSSLCIIFGLYKFIVSGDPNNLMLENSLFIDIHRVIMSLYLTIGLYFCFELYKHQMTPWFLYLYIAVASTHIFLMASRLFLVVYLLFVVFLLFKNLNNKRSLYLTLSSGFLVCLVSGTFLYIKNDRFKSQINSLVNISIGKQSEVNGVSDREYQWKAGIQIVKTAPLIGIGIGDVVDSLQRQYKNMNWGYGYDMRFHAHNQYLQTTIGMGIIGLIMLILLMAFPFIYYKSTPVDAKIATTLFGISLITDNHLELQQSVMFMLLWLSIFNNNVFNEIKTDNT